MKYKKNPNVDLNKKSSFYFSIGLVLVLFISWQAIEYKNIISETDRDRLAIDAEDDEEIPITEQIQKLEPPPPPPPEPEVIEVVEDEEEIEETIIQDSETDQEEIIEVVEVVEEYVDTPVPFAIIEDVPLFPGCERVAKSERRSCFQSKIQQHIAKNFRYPEIAQEMGIQGRVFVQFTIGTNGSISGIRTRGPDKNLEKEANRIISLLPRMTPGKQRGRPVRVPFSIPITFKLQ